MMHKQVSGIRMYVQYLLSMMLPRVPIAYSFSSAYYAPSAYFPLHAPLMPSAFLVASASSASSSFSVLTVSFAFPDSSALSVSLLYTNLASIYHYRECFQSSDCNWISDKQCEVVIHTLQEEKDLLIALPTNSRKLMVLILAAMLGGRKTFLVIMFLISLFEDWKHQLKLSGTKYSIFQHGMYMFSDSLIILATIDLAIKLDLIECIGNAYVCKSFGEVVIDEVYNVLVSHKV